MQRFDDTGNADPVRLRGWVIESTRELYRKALNTGDYALALNAMKELHRFIMTKPPRRSAGDASRSKRV